MLSCKMRHMSKASHQPSAAESIDPRERRSRAAILSAAIALVSERASTEFSVTDLAEAAGVSRRVLYQHYGDREGALIAAAMDLMTRELAEEISELAGADGPSPDRAMEAIAPFAQHFAQHRGFYRALLTGPCAHQLQQQVSAFFMPASRDAALQTYGDLDEATVAEVADYFTAGTTMFFINWIREGPEPLDPHEFATRLRRIQSVLAPPERSTAPRSDSDPAMPRTSATPEKPSTPTTGEKP